MHCSAAQCLEKFVVIGIQVPPPLPLSKQHVCPGNTVVGSINFRTVDFGGAVFNWSYCVPRVPSDTLALRGVMVLFCVEAADRGMMAFVAYFAS